MKILLANKFYYRRGGDCVYMLNLELLLREHGHEVAVFAMDYPDNLETPWENFFPSEIKFKPGLGMIETLLRPFGTNEVKRKFCALLDKFKPDVVHLNNIHTQLSPVIGEIAHRRGIKVVWTLHDLKLLCPRYDCLRNGKIACEECFTDKYKVLKYRCMKNSIIASALAYKEAVLWNRERLECCTDNFICPSEFMANKMIQGGFNKAQMHILCNFIDVEKTKKQEYNKDDYYCFIGRLSNEKGVSTLVKAARELPHKLKIIGEGPLMEELRILAIGTNIELVGYKQWAEIKEIVGHARFSVISSECNENNPLSVIEAQCLGTPVLGARIGGIPELIEEGKCGMLFESKDIKDLKKKIEMMYAYTFNYEVLAKSSQEKYSADVYYRQLMKIYTR